MQLRPTMIIEIIAPLWGPVMSIWFLQMDNMKAFKRKNKELVKEKIFGMQVLIEESWEPPPLSFFKMNYP